MSKKTSPAKKTNPPGRSNPSATVSKPPEETVGPSQEDLAQAPPERVTPDPVPGSSQPDTSIPLEEPQEDLPPQAVTLDVVRNYLAVAGEDERALIWTELAPDAREAGHQATLNPARGSFAASLPRHCPKVW